MAVDDNQQPPAADAAPAPAPESKVKPEVVPAGASEHVQQAAAAAQQPAPESSLATMPVRAYLDETVVPLLLRGNTRSRANQLLSSERRARSQGCWSWRRRGQKTLWNGWAISCWPTRIPLSNANSEAGRSCLLLNTTGGAHSTCTLACAAPVTAYDMSLRQPCERPSSVVCRIESIVHRWWRRGSRIMYGIGFGGRCATSRLGCRRRTRHVRLRRRRRDLFRERGQTDAPA